MEKEKVYEELNKVFQTVFDDDSLMVNENTTAADIEDWDSLEQINLIVGIEKAFSIKFSIDEVKNMKNVGDMADAILTKAAGNE